MRTVPASADGAARVSGVDCPDRHTLRRAVMLAAGLSGQGPSPGPGGALSCGSQCSRAERRLLAAGATLGTGQPVGVNAEDCIITLLGASSWQMAQVCPHPAGLWSPKGLSGLQWAAAADQAWRPVTAPGSVRLPQAHCCAACWDILVQTMASLLGSSVARVWQPRCRGWL